MWKFSHTLPVNASKDIVWDMWYNIEKWPDWDPQLEAATLFDVHAQGVQGQLKAKGQSPVTFTIAEVVDHSKLVHQASFTGARVNFIHQMEEKDGKLFVTHGVEISGLLGWFWRFMMASSLQQSIPSALENFVKIAEDRQKKGVTPQHPDVNGDTKKDEEPEKSSENASAPPEEATSEDTVTEGTDESTQASKGVPGNSVSQEHEQPTEAVEKPSEDTVEEPIELKAEEQKEAQSEESAQETAAPAEKDEAKPSESQAEDTVEDVPAKTENSDATIPNSQTEQSTSTTLTSDESRKEEVVKKAEEAAAEETPPTEQTLNTPVEEAPAADTPAETVSTSVDSTEQPAEKVAPATEQPKEEQVQSEAQSNASSDSEHKTAEKKEG